MRLRPTQSYRSPAYPALVLAALAGTGAAANGANLIIKGRPAAPKMLPVESKPTPTLGEMPVVKPLTEVVDVGPVDRGSTAFVSVATLAKHLGVQVSNRRSQAGRTLSLGKSSVTLTPGRQSAIVNGRGVRLPAAPRMVNGILHVPTRAIGEALGLIVTRRGWDLALITSDAHKMLILRTAPPKPVPAPGMPGLPEMLRRYRKGS